MPEGPEPDGGRILSEAEELELRRIEEARASLEMLLKDERDRRRNRWIFFGGLFIGVVLLLPFLALYIALIVYMATSVV